MTDDLRAILHAAAQVPPPLLQYGLAPARHRLHPGLMLLASGPEGGAGEQAVLLFEPVTPEQFFLWTTEFFGAEQPFSVTVEVGLAEGAQRGCISAILTATTMGYPVYVRMGFAPVAVFRTYLPGLPSRWQDRSETLS